MGWLDFTVVFTQESFGVIRERIIGNGANRPTFANRWQICGTVEFIYSIETPTASLD
jgi:hypothetical protein